jgi:hypothetical protein
MDRCSVLYFRLKRLNALLLTTLDNIGKYRVLSNSDALYRKKTMYYTERLSRIMTLLNTTEKEFTEKDFIKLC